MGDARADVFLLATCGSVDALLVAQDPDVASDGADVASEDLSEVFLAEESVLIAGFFGEADEPNAAGGFCSVLIADFEVFRIEQCQGDGGHLAFFETLAGTLIGTDAFVAELAASQWGFAGVLEVDLADDFNDDTGFPGAHLSAIDDLVDHALVLSLGFEAMLLFELAALCILYHGCLWFVFDPGNPYWISPIADTHFTRYRPNLVGADTCPNRKYALTKSAIGTTRKSMTYVKLPFDESVRSMRKLLSVSRQEK